eukprot:Nk52_evm1s777 gene=Nk52_evmTU1s777
MKHSFKGSYGEWALITGATSGIGEEFARQVAAEGLNVVLVARNKEVLKQKAEALEAEYGISTLCVSADMSKEEDIEKVMTETKHLEVGLLIPNVGLETLGPILNVPIERHLQVVKVNCDAVLRMVHHFSRDMVTRGRGGILLVASVSAHGPNPYMATYGGSKAFVLNFGISLSHEMKTKGVDVTVLSPGPTETPMIGNVKHVVDFSKGPTSIMEPKDVALAGLEALGKKPVVIPGKKNNFFIFVGSRLLSIKTQISQAAKISTK